MKKYMILILLILFIIFIGGCGSNTKNNSTEINVFAAASLTESMKEIVSEFEKEHPDINIQLNLASSSRLRIQIEQGMQADIFLSANKKHYDKLEKKGLVAAGKNFLTNCMVLVLPKNNPANIKNLRDLEKGCKLVLAQEEVPAGNYALQILRKLNNKYGADYNERVLKNLVSKENNVKQVLAKVVLGEADAAFVYASDITEDIKNEVEVITIPEEYNVRATYWAALIKGSEDKEAAMLFYSYISGKKAQNTFLKYGFNIPG